MFVGMIVPALWPCRLQLQQKLRMVLQAKEHLLHYLKCSRGWLPHALQDWGSPGHMAIVTPCADVSLLTAYLAVAGLRPAQE